MKLIPWSQGGTVHLLDPSPSFDERARPTLCGFAQLARDATNHTPPVIAPTCLRCIRVVKRGVESTRRPVDKQGRPYDWQLDGI